MDKLPNLVELIERAPEQTKQFILDLLAVSQGVEYGIFNLKLNVHQKSISKAEFRGWKTKNYGKSEQDQQRALRDLAERIAEAKKKKSEVKLHFLVNVKGGYITGIYWDSFIERKYLTDGV